MDDGPATAAEDGKSARRPVQLAREPSRRLGSLLIEPAVRRISRVGGEEAFVQPRIMQVLVALLRANGQILTRDDLIASCWDGVIVGDDAINRALGLLRRLGEGVGRDSFQIETINKVGYRLLTTETSESQMGAAGPEADSAAGAGDSRPRICVLPFANLSGDSEQEYFSDGISEDIITDLSKVSALLVVSRNKAFAFKGQNIDVTQIAVQLNVRHLLEGSVRKAGNRVRITAQLIDGATGDHLWAERYDRELEDIFLLQDEISQAIVDALKLKLLPEEKQAIAQRGTDDVEAYNLYLMARQYLVSGNQGNPNAGETIIRLCTKATDIDPGYARAWALLAHAQTSLRLAGSKLDDGLESAEKALSLDFGLAEAHAIRARHMFLQDRREEASSEIEMALRLDPESYEVNESAGLLALKEKRYQLAIRYYEKAAALYETSVNVMGMLISCYAALGDAPGLRRAAQITLERAEKALSRDQYNGTAMGFGASALVVLGETDRARDWIDRALLIDPANDNMRYNFACSLAAHLGDTDGAIDLLEPFFDTAKSGDLHHARLDPDLDSIRSDPRVVRMFNAAQSRLAAADNIKTS